MVKGYPDWATNVIQKEGTEFVVTGNVDANITNAEIDAHVTNSKISIEPAEGSEFVIKPAESTVFNVQGSVDANITNSSLDVHVTNSALDVNVQGTANVEIQNAQLNVQTLREQASAANKVEWAGTELDLANASSYEAGTLYENNTGHDVYLEQILIALKPTSSNPPSVEPYEHVFYIEIGPTGNPRVIIFANYIHSPINFDPAIPVHDGEKIQAWVYGVDKQNMHAVVDAIIRKP